MTPFLRREATLKDFACGEILKPNSGVANLQKRFKLHNGATPELKLTRELQFSRHLRWEISPAAKSKVATQLRRFRLR